MHKILIHLLLIGFFQFSISAQDAKQVVENYLQVNQSVLGFTSDDLTAWKISSEQFNKKNESTQVYIQQYAGEIQILNAIGILTTTESGKISFNETSMVKNIASKINSNNPTLNQAAAILKAKSNIYNILEETVSAELIYFNNETSLQLSFLVSFETQDHQHYYFKVIDALNGNLLNQWDQVLHCSFGHTGFSPAHSAHKSHANYRGNNNRRAGDAQYNVFAIPAESPIHGPRLIVSGVEDAIASPYGWHDVNAQVGPEFTTTRGNNVSAYDDSGNNNFQGYAPDGGANLVFDYPIDFNEAPQSSKDAAITNLFYMSNFMHDFSYRYGFDEQSGNFQQNNYGNGGANADYVLAEALDGSGTNNANFMTLWDGAKPRMQMYVWNGNSGTGEYLTVNNPSELAGSYIVALAAFGAPVNEVPISGDLAILVDDTEPFNDACTPAINSNELAGKFAVIDRGDCTFEEKVAIAQNSDAIGVVVVNNVDGPASFMAGDDASITIPAVMISKSNGETIKSALNNDTTINITLTNSTPASPDLDGDYDNGIIAHEYGHGISTRLVGGRMNAFCLTNKEQMGEGWSDFFGLMATINLDVENPIRRPIGTYVTSESPDEGFGIRPVPYDTSMAVNDYTYGDIINTEISIPHGVGFIWCTALWEMTWALIDEYGYDEDLYTGTGGNNIALQLVTDGMKLLNCNPGFVNGRDAILKADSLYYDGAYKCIIWEAFAKRGLGYSAVQNSSNNLFDSEEAFDMPPSCTERNEEVAFFADATEVCDGEVQFMHQSTLVPYEWLWNFGDGETSTEPAPLHVYSESGTYNVELYVESPDGFGTHTEASYITVTLPSIPTNIIANDACIGDEILVTASNENTLLWNINDGATVVGDTIYQTLSQPNTNFVATNQIIINSDTCYSESVAIVVLASEANYTFEIEDLTVAFSDSSIQANSWLWDFGNGQTSSEQNPTHVYTQPGVYDVTLSINGAQCEQIQIVDLSVTSILEQLSESYMTIAPNPANQFVTIELSTTIPKPNSIKVFNTEGKLISISLTLLRNNVYQLDVSEWASGMYTIQMIGDQYQIQNALIVTKNK